jgi:hypothetical protein
MHIYCGAWDLKWDGITTDECGEDVGDNLIHGDTVAGAWHDGAIRWNLSAINRDHLWGHGAVTPDLAPARQACLLWYWTEG